MNRSWSAASAKRAVRRGRAAPPDPDAMSHTKGQRAALGTDASDRQPIAQNEGVGGPDGPAVDGSVRRLDVALLALVVGLSLGSLVVWRGVGLPGLPNAVALDIAINVAATLVGAAVAILAWVRWRETREAASLYESSAFVALTSLNALILGILVTGQERAFGLSPAAPGEAPVYAWTLSRLTAALLLVLGATRSLRRSRPPVPAPVIALAPAVALVVAAVMLFGREAMLPPVPAADVFGPGALGPLQTGPIEALVVVVQVLIFAAFIAASLLYRRLFQRDRTVSHAFLAAGLVVAAFSQLHFALDPVVATGIVTTSDALRLAFYAVLFMGIQAELESDLRALRHANVELRRLGEVEAANAAMAERTRLAREIHDGLAQDLWYAKLKQGRLAHDPQLRDPARTTAREVLTALDSALAEARQAVAAMRADRPAGSSLEEVLRAHVDDFADRFGVRTEFTSRGPLPRLPARTQAEVLRIVQEALTNVRRHADATLVRVEADAVDGTAALRVTVADNGRGFDPGTLDDARFGLRGMRERAEMVGAALRIDSRPADGTRVVIDLVPGEPAAGGAP